MNQDLTSPATTDLPGQNAPGTRPKPRRTYRKHSLTRLLRGRYKANAGQLDGRLAVSQAMTQYRAELLASLGGSENLSAQELTLVEMCAKDWLILQSVDAYLLQAGLFNKRKRAAYPLTVQRMQIADSLTRRLQSLGLKRVAKPAMSLQDYLTKAKGKEEEGWDASGEVPASAPDAEGQHREGHCA